MSERRETWVYGCLCAVIALGLAFLIISPIFGLLFIIITSLTIAIIYIYRTQDFEITDERSVRPISSTEEETEPIEQESVLEQFRKQWSDPIQEVRRPNGTFLFVPSEHKAEPEESDTVKELQQRIAELEHRVHSLNEQLADDQIMKGNQSIPVSDASEKQNDITDEELSETAIQHLLETLEEKLAKRAISKQLYTRLRDKYIARMEKSKKRRKASAKRGTKTPI